MTFSKDFVPENKTNTFFFICLYNDKREKEYEQHGEDTSYGYLNIEVI
jgi:hypothetical protein